MKPFNPYDWSPSSAGSDDDEKQEAPEIVPLWQQAFRQAATSGLVDGGAAQGSGPITSGTVSDQP